MCVFDEAWVGKCREPGEPFCEKHATLVCASCGAQAVKTCDATGGFACGAPLCGECEHTLSPSGCCSPGMTRLPPTGMEAHCRYVHEGEPQTHQRKRDEFEGTPVVSALVLATPENIAAVRALELAFRTLHDRLLDFLDPRQIDKTLSQAVGVLRLAAPESGKDTHVDTKSTRTRRRKR